MSSIKSEDNEIDIKKYSNKLKDTRYKSEYRVRESFYSVNEMHCVPLITNTLMHLPSSNIKTPI